MKFSSLLARMWLTATLAVRDWRHERLLSLCSVLALASVLTPLLVLFGVRYGVLSVLQERLMQDPAILTVTPTGSASYTPDYIEKLRQVPGVDFVIPRTRDIAATLQLSSGTDNPIFSRASMEPSAPGDPLLSQANIVFPSPAESTAAQGVPSEDLVVLSASVAQKLKVEADALISGQIGRKNPEGGLESANLPLRVHAILPLGAEERDVVFVSLPFLDAAERFRDYIAVPERGLGGDPPPPSRTYAGFRLYAKTLNDVEPLRLYFANQNIEVLTKAREIGVVQGLDRSLTLIFFLIALTAGVGFMASTASSVLAAVRRKDKQLGMLCLVGLPPLAIMAYPMIQALLTGLCGTLVAGLVYYGVSVSIDSLFAAQLYGAEVCKLPLPQYLIALALVLLLSALASVQASLRAARIEPSEVLREL